MRSAAASARGGRSRADRARDRRRSGPGRRPSGSTVGVARGPGVEDERARCRGRRRGRRSASPRRGAPGSPRPPARSRRRRRGASGGVRRAARAARAGPRSPRAAASSSGPSATASRGRIACVSGSPKRALHSSRTGPSVGQHQARVERATERGAASGQLGQDRPVEAVEQGSAASSGQVRQRRCRRPSRRCSGRGRRRRRRLWSRAIGSGDRAPPVAQGDEARLAPGRAAPRRRPRPVADGLGRTGRSRRSPVRLVERVADRHALAGRQAVRLDDDARAAAARSLANATASVRSCERARARHRDAGGRGDLVAERLARSRSGPRPRSARRPRTRPRSSASATPAASGASGPMTTSSAASRRATATTAARSSGSTPGTQRTRGSRRDRVAARARR